MFAFAPGEQANAVAKNNRDHRNCDIVNQASSEKLTDYLAAINVYPHSINESVHHLYCRARKEFLRMLRLRRTMGHHDDALANVRPSLVFENSFIRVLTHYDRIHTRHECLIPVRLIDRMN